MGSTSRRTFLGLVGAGTAAAALAACGDGRERSAPTVTRSGSRSPASVLVVGAGLAGLTAATVLADEGLDVQVLEARPRVGGRTWTVAEPFDDDQHSDAGGEFVDGGHTRLRKLVDDLGLELEDTGSDDDTDELIVYDGETLTPTEFDERSGGSAAEGVEAYEDAVASLVSEIDPDNPVGSADAEEFDATSVGTALDELDLSPEARFVVDHLVVGEYMVDPYDLSLLFFLQVNAAVWDEDEEEAWRIRGGAQQVADGLAARLERVQTGTPVLRIDDRGDRVVVHTADDTSEADHLVVATPLAPLRSVEFDAGLPDPLRAAIAECGYGIGGKTMLQYDRRYWSDAGWGGSATTDLDIGLLYESTVGQRGRAGILNTYTAGPAGLVAGGLDPETRQRSARDEIESITKATAGAGGSASVMWQNEPFSGGTYVAYRPGQVIPFWDAVRTPVRRVHFAGEHTDVLNTYMEGAIRSGYRVADEILADID